MPIVYIFLTGEFVYDGVSYEEKKGIKIMYYGGLYYGFDWTYILVILGAVITLLASTGVKTTFSKYSNVRSKSNMTGAEAARRILDSQGLYNVQVRHVGGSLTDHYDPRTETVNLSDSTYASASVAAVGVAAHECGHAKQHAVKYFPLQLRSTLVPAANLGSKLGIPLIILGVFLSMNHTLISIGIWVFCLAVLFQIVTLPVEFNASHRALILLEENGILTADEVPKSRAVLKAAALTYVAAAAASVMQLLRLIILFGGNSRKKN